MSARLFLGDPGAGKTSLMACILKSIYRTKGRRLLNNSIDLILRLNKSRGIEPFEIPEQPPIYTDVTSFKVKFKVGYEEWFEPYVLNPYYMGVENKKIDTQYVLPYSQIFIPEIQKYADSRKGQTFPAQLSRIFEIRRHFHLDIFMDGHRGRFIDLKIRGMCDRVIEIQKQEHERDELGRIIKTIWYVREFEGYAAYEAYCERGGSDYVENTYSYDGNIFKIYDSFGCENEFVPTEGKGAQFSTLKPLTMEEVKRLPKEIAKFYNPNEPKGFRTGA